MAFHLLVLVSLWRYSPPHQVSPHSKASVIQAQLIPDTNTQPSPAAPTELTQPNSPSLPAPQGPYVVTTEQNLKYPLSATTSNLSPAGYLPIEAVDQPATPLGDWEINPDMLPRNTTLRVNVQLWISAQGTINQWDLLDESMANVGLVREALHNLQQTRLQPALLNHIAVPSVRRLELVISRE